MEEIHEAFDYSDKISVYNDGKVAQYNSGTDNYNTILSGWKCIIEGAHQMPAFGVSIDRLTREELKKGLWVEFDFEKELKVWEMPFEKLLVNINKDFFGFNIIRYTAEYGYDGRCFYLDLVNKNMAEFYDLILKI